MRTHDSPSVWQEPPKAPVGYLYLLNASTVQVPSKGPTCPKIGIPGLFMSKY
jgi:hypothetical protein